MEIDKLKDIINNSKYLVFFGGAGVSTASGIPDFRSKDGLYNMKYKYSPEEILSNHFFYENTLEFYTFYKDKMNALNIEPNIIHKTLAKMESDGKLKCIITQNIDGLHTKAGSKNVLEIHGTIYKNRCIKCNKSYSAEYVFSSSDIPKCDCGGIIKPEVVLYEEALGSEFDQALEEVSKADTLIVAGTSLSVYPAANLVRIFKGNNLVLINKDKTAYDELATLVINEPLEKVDRKSVV